MRDLYRKVPKPGLAKGRGRPRYQKYTKNIPKYIPNIYKYIQDIQDIYKIPGGGQAAAARPGPEPHRPKYHKMAIGYDKPQLL